MPPRTIPLRLALTLAMAALLASNAACDRSPPARRGPTATTARPGAARTTSTAARGGPARPGYTIDATLDLGANRVIGTVAVVFAPDRPTDRLVFRLWPNGPTPARAGGHVDTGQVTLRRHSVASHLEGATILVVETGPLSPGATVRATVPFTVTLPGRIPDRLARVGDAVRLGSWFPILAWEPGVGWATDPPTSGFAEASLSTAVDFEVTLRTPPGFAVLATGTQVTPGHWTAEAVPDWAATVGHFTTATETVGGVKITVGVDRQVHEVAARYLPVVTNAIRQMSARYGPYPWPEYQLAITPALSGGIEYPGHVMQGSRTEGRTTTHEVAHQWFYALVGSDQGRDPWLDEGLATWAEARVLGTLDALRARPIPAAGAGHMGEPMTFWEPRLSVYYRSVYLQPLHALVALGVGPDVIDGALAQYVRDNKHRVATPGDLVRTLNNVAPRAADVFARFGVSPPPAE